MQALLAEQLMSTGMILIANRQFPEAIEALSQAYQVEPSFTAAYNIARCHQAMSAFAEAIGFYSRAVTYTHPLRGWAYLNRAICQIGLAKFEAAAEDVMQAESLAPDLTIEILLVKASVQDLLGERQAAVASYTAILRVRPNDQKARARRAELNTVDGEYERSIEDLTILIDQGFRIVGCLGLRAHCYTQTTNFEAALADYAAILRLEPWNDRVRFERCLLLIETEQQEKALAEADEMVAANPNLANIGLRADLYKKCKLPLLADQNFSADIQDLIKMNSVL